MDVICSNGILSFGYLDEYFPFFYMEKGQHRGLSLQIWRIVAKRFSCRRSGLGISLQETENNASMTQLSLFEAASNNTEEGWTPYEFFFVFSPPILVLIIISTIVIQLANKSNTRLKSTPGLCFRYLVLVKLSILFSAAILNLFILHAAVFKGNTIVAAKPALLHWDDIVADLWSGSKHLLESAANLDDSEYGQLMGSNRPIRSGSTVNAMTELCKRRTSTIAALYDTQVLYITDIGSMPKDCQIHRIPPHGNSTLINENFLPSTFVYLIPRKNPAKIVEKINEIILKLFTFEKVMISDFWMHKELRRPSSLQKETPQKQEISSVVDPLSLTSLAGIFLAYIAGLLVSFLILIVEITTIRSPHFERAHMCIIPYLD
ncbi:hypothetical protein PRIPAC_95753 [Pristionchus pacificus]|uniref:Uncharacterized protein n=1 Tax=Pristionchus pacificus TaxID=54126 RepID=A0A2A6D1T7_PRIPA|nr:hypothetical protein PRIPAC_95753 [Pristionchus pacificus]|eukprot:PDM84348.1 hypothetical protein PRIPAC_33371 [Pristionchus pacificus]